jgi:protein SCO1/2
MRKRWAGLGLVAIVGTALVAGALPGRQVGAAPRHALDVSGSAAPLQLAMTRASDGKPVTQADYRGRIVLLYLGYTFCPDVCPTTLSNVADVLKQLGSEASQVRVLFVTVDPDRDTLPVLAAYAANFGPEVESLRGTPDQLAALARRYRLVYSVTPETKDHPYEVTHSSAIYVFDRSGAARLLVPSLGTAAADIAALTDDLRRLVEGGRPPDLPARLLRWL